MKGQEIEWDNILGTVPSLTIPGVTTDLEPIQTKKCKQEIINISNVY